MKSKYRFRNEGQSKSLALRNSCPLEFYKGSRREVNKPSSPRRYSSYIIIVSTKVVLSKRNSAVTE